MSSAGGEPEGVKNCYRSKYPRFDMSKSGKRAITWNTLSRILLLVKLFNFQHQHEQNALFWKGLLIPIAPTLAAYLLLNVGILSGSSYPDFLGLSFFMFSFCLWPVIGFGLAYSSNTFVKPFRKGSLISAVLGLIIAILFWTLFFSWMSRGLAA